MMTASSQPDQSAFTPTTADERWAWPGGPPELMATDVRRAAHRVTIQPNAEQLQYVEGNAGFYAQGGNTGGTPTAVLHDAKRVPELCAAALAHAQVPPGQMFISGHAPRRGYAIERCWSDEECSAAPGDCLELAMRPPRFITNRQHAERLVKRWNRRFAKR